MHPPHPRRIFDLSFNSLSGTIPTEIRTMGTHAHPDEWAIDPEDLPPEQLVKDENGFYPENITLDNDQFTTDPNDSDDDMFEAPFVDFECMRFHAYA